MTEELEDFHYPSLQAFAPSLDLSDPSVFNNIFNHMIAEIKFDMTSVHDVSLRDGWSKVIQGVMEMLPAVEALLLNFTEVWTPCHTAANKRHRGWTTRISSTLPLVSSLLRTTAIGMMRPWNKLPSILLNSCNSERSISELSHQTSPDERRTLRYPSNGDTADGDSSDGGASDSPNRDWWEDEDPEAPWMTQATRLMPKSTIALWQFTP